MTREEIIKTLQDIYYAPPMDLAPVTDYDCRVVCEQLRLLLEELKNDEAV